VKLEKVQRLVLLIVNLEEDSVAMGSVNQERHLRIVLKIVFLPLLPPVFVVMDFVKVGRHLLPVLLIVQHVVMDCVILERLLQIVPAIVHQEP